MLTRSRPAVTPLLPVTIQPGAIRYAPGVREEQTLHRGDVIGYVGSTGNASPDAPHLHFAIFRLTPDRQWWKGEPVNPYPVFK